MSSKRSNLVPLVALTATVSTCIVFYFLHQGRAQENEEEPPLKEEEVHRTAERATNSGELSKANKSKSKIEVEATPLLVAVSTDDSGSDTCSVDEKPTRTIDVIIEADKGAVEIVVKNDQSPPVPIQPDLTVVADSGNAAHGSTGAKGINASPTDESSVGVGDEKLEKQSSLEVAVLDNMVTPSQVQASLVSSVELLHDTTPPVEPPDQVNNEASPTTLASETPSRVEVEHPTPEELVEILKIPVTKTLELSHQAPLTTMGSEISTSKTSQTPDNAVGETQPPTNNANVKETEEFETTDPAETPSCNVEVEQATPPELDEKPETPVTETTEQNQQTAPTTPASVTSTSKTTTPPEDSVGEMRPPTNDASIRNNETIETTEVEDKQPTLPELVEKPGTPAVQTEEQNDQAALTAPITGTPTSETSTTPDDAVEEWQHPWSDAKINEMKSVEIKDLVTELWPGPVSERTEEETRMEVELLSYLQNEMLRARFCAGCDKDEGSEKFKPCAKCRSVLYCDRACQKKHWKVHKKLCCK